MTDFFAENRSKIRSAARAGAVGFFAAGSAVGIGYAAKPEEFMNFMSNHIAVIGLGAAALAVIAVMMYAAYKYAQKNENYDNSPSHIRQDGGTQMDKEEVYEEPPLSPLSPAKSPCPLGNAIDETSSFNRGFSFSGR